MEKNVWGEIETRTGKEVEVRLRGKTYPIKEELKRRKYRFCKERRGGYWFKMVRWEDLVKELNNIKHICNKFIAKFSFEQEKLKDLNCRIEFNEKSWKPHELEHAKEFFEQVYREGGVPYGSALIIQ